MSQKVERPWLKHDGGPNPAPGQSVDLIWGIGEIHGQPSDRVNWSFKWQWRPSGRAALAKETTDEG